MAGGMQVRQQHLFKKALKTIKDYQNGLYQMLHKAFQLLCTTVKNSKNAGFLFQ